MIDSVSVVVTVEVLVEVGTGDVEVEPNWVVQAEIVAAMTCVGARRAKASRMKVDSILMDEL